MMCIYFFMNRFVRDLWRDTWWKRTRYLHARIQKVLSEGSKFDYLFFSWSWDRGCKYHYKWAIISPSAKRHLNGVSLAGRWWPNIECWLESFVIFQRTRTSIAKKPYIFVIFQGGPDSLSPPPLDPPMIYTHKKLKRLELFFIVSRRNVLRLHQTP